MGVSKEDGMLPLIFFCINWFVSICFLCLFVWRRKRIVKLYQRLASVDRRVSNSSTSSGRLRGATAVWTSYFSVIYLLSLGTGACYAILMHKTFSSTLDGQLSPLDWLAVFFFSFASSFSATNPMIGSSVVCLCDVLVALGDICFQWEGKMRVSVCHNPDQKASAKLLHSQISVGNDFCELVSFTNETFSPFVVMIYMYFLAGGVMYAYGGGALLMQSPEGTIPLLLCIAAFLISTIFCVTIWTVSFVGNRFTEKRDAAIAMLGQVVYQAYSDVDDRTKFQAQELLDRLKQANISPYGYFEISNSNFLSVIATNATYIIVLLQFKSGTDESTTTAPM